MVNSYRVAMIDKHKKLGKCKVSIALAGTSRSNGMVGIVVFGLLIVSAYVFFPSRMRAQGETTSAIVGQVADETHAAIPGATVAIVNAETGLERRARTDNEGRFNFPQLSPGTYSVKLEAEGFEPQQSDHVVAGLGQKQTVNFVLKIASLQQAVEVSGVAPL